MSTDLKAWNYTVFDDDHASDLTAAEIATLANSDDWTENRIAGMLSGTDTGFRAYLTRDCDASDPEEFEHDELTYARFNLSSRKYVYGDFAGSEVPQSLIDAYERIDSEGGEFDIDSRHADSLTRAFCRYARLLGWSIHVVTLQGTSQSDWCDMLWIIPIDADIDDYTGEWVDYFAGDVYGAIVGSDDYAISDNSVWGLYGDDYAMQTLSEYVRYALEEISQTIKDNKRKAMCA